MENRAAHNYRGLSNFKSIDLICCRYLSVGYRLMQLVCGCFGISI